MPVKVECIHAITVTGEHAQKMLELMQDIIRQSPHSGVDPAYIRLAKEIAGQAGTKVIMEPSIEKS